MYTSRRTPVSAWRRTARLAVASLCIVIGVALLAACSSDTQEGAVHVLHTDGDVGPIMERYIDRGIDRAEANNARLVVIELDTPGGYSESMRKIVQRIEASDVPVAVYVSPAGARAASAGTFITMAAHVAAMAPNTSIGAASAINSDGSDIAGTLGRKVENDAVAMIRGIADLRGRNADWAESAVRDAVAIGDDEAVQLNVVDFRANDFDDLLRQAEGRTFDLKPGMEVTLRGLPDAPVVRTDMTPWEHILDFVANPTVASILIAIGFFAILAEVMSPGLVVPGAVGAISLTLGFLGYGVLPVDTTGIVLIGIGLALLALEIFLPGGILGVLGLVALFFGGMIAFRDAPPGTRPPLLIVIPLAIVLAAMFLSMGMAVSRVRKLNAKSGTQALVGKTATVRTPLTPEGFVFVQGERWRAGLANGIAQEGDQVRIVGAEGFTLRVEQMEREDAT